MRLLNRVVVAVSCTTVVFAQAGQGAITGTVTDPNRDPVIGQSVLVRNKATKSVYEAPLSEQSEAIRDEFDRSAQAWDITLRVAARDFDQKQFTRH